MTPPKTKPKPRMWLTRDANGNFYNIHRLKTFTICGVWQDYFAYVSDYGWEAANPAAKLPPGGGPIEISGGFRIVNPAKRKKVAKP